MLYAPITVINIIENFVQNVILRARKSVIKGYTPYTIDFGSFIIPCACTAMEDCEKWPTPSQMLYMLVVLSLSFIYCSLSLFLDMIYHILIHIVKLLKQQANTSIHVHYKSSKG